MSVTGTGSLPPNQVPPPGGTTNPPPAPPGGVAPNNPHAPVKPAPTPAAPPKVLPPLPPAKPSPTPAAAVIPAPVAAPVQVDLTPGAVSRVASAVRSHVEDATTDLSGLIRGQQNRNNGKGMMVALVAAIVLCLLLVALLLGFGRDSSPPAPAAPAAPAKAGSDEVADCIKECVSDQVKLGFDRAKAEPICSESCGLMVNN